ncbi:MAG: type II toxin-antitoxin system VapC family toxin [Kineosporiaceae bacterium]
MTILLDTSILIDHLRGTPDARAALKAAVRDGERLAASVLTKVEVLSGMRPEEEQATRGLLASLDLIAVDDAVAERAGGLANQYLRSYPGVDPVDYVIAATAQHLDAALWTRNLKHFPMFPELESPY